MGVNRITGLNSGMDTEALVTSLVSSYQKKVDNLTGNQKRHEWKQEAWKSLNKSYVGLYNGKLDKMTMKSSFMKKITTASNSSAVSIKTKDGAMNATQRLKVNKTATSAFTTGAKLTNATNGGATTLAELGAEKNAEGKYTLTINTGKMALDEQGNPVPGGQTVNGSVTLEFEEGATIDDVISKIKNTTVEGADGTKARFNANFDANQGRVYMSAAATGDYGNFTFESGSLADALGLSNGRYNAGSDAEIMLNGEIYNSDSNTFDINGLSITANEVTAEEFSITTKTDTSGIYDMIKDFFKDYNEMIKTLDGAYYADSSAKFKMLTEDEKYAMSEKEVDEWEKKVKDGLLSRDATLSSITSGLKSAMLDGIEVTRGDGTTGTLRLSDFGIGTGSYLTTAKEERGVFHIDGDKDDNVTSSATDKLQAMIDSDPEAVADFFSKLAQNVRKVMFDQMKGTQYSSSFTIYEDKLMAQQYSSYNSQIASATERLNKKQDAYYAKFTRMEKAMAKTNAVQSNLGSYFG